MEEREDRHPIKRLGHRMHRTFFCFVLLMTGPKVLATEVKAPELVVMSYNLENYLTMPRQVDGKSEPEAPKPEPSILAVVANILHARPDILGVCEIGTLEDLQDLQTRLAAGGLDLPHREHCGGADPTRFLGLLSRYPIQERNSQSHLGYDLQGVRELVQRGILDVTIQPPGFGPIRFLGVHFKSKRPVPQGEARMRRNEALLLRKHLDSIFKIDPDSQVLVQGDFNENKNEPTLQSVLGPRNEPGSLRMLDLTDGVGDRWTHYWEAADQYSRIDYLLVSPNLAESWIPEKSRVERPQNWRLASDHRPLVATFAQKEKTAP